MSGSKKEIVFLTTVSIQGLILLIFLLLLIKYFYDRFVETFQPVVTSSAETPNRRAQNGYAQLYARIQQQTEARRLELTATELTATEPTAVQTAPLVTVTRSESTSQPFQESQRAAVVISCDEAPEYHTAIQLPVPSSRPNYTTQTSKPPTYEEYLNEILISQSEPLVPQSELV